MGSRLRIAIKKWTTPQRETSNPVKMKEDDVQRLVQSLAKGGNQEIQGDVVLCHLITTGTGGGHPLIPLGVTTATHPAGVTIIVEGDRGLALLHPLVAIVPGHAIGDH
jgi:hypothetical protein